MPKNLDNLDQGLIDAVDNWNNDGTPETSDPLLTIGPATQIGSTSADMNGMLNENGRDTQALFKYWKTGLSQTEGCPDNNTIFTGCTTTTSPTGSGGDDTAYNYSITAGGLNCNTSYTYHARSNSNGAHDSQKSLDTFTFSTAVGAGDADSDFVCDAVDNCPDDKNPLQEDANNNGIGDACDAQTDSLCFPVKTSNGDLAIICL